MSEDGMCDENEVRVHTGRQPDVSKGQGRWEPGVSAEAEEDWLPLEWWHTQHQEPASEVYKSLVLATGVGRTEAELQKWKCLDALERRAL